MDKSFVKGRWKIGVFIREWGLTAKSERGNERKRGEIWETFTCFAILVSTWEQQI